MNKILTILYYIFFGFVTKAAASIYLGTSMLAAWTDSNLEYLLSNAVIFILPLLILWYGHYIVINYFVRILIKRPFIEDSGIDSIFADKKVRNIFSSRKREDRQIAKELRQIKPAKRERYFDEETRMGVPTIKDRRMKKFFDWVIKDNYDVWDKRHDNYQGFLNVDPNEITNATIRKAAKIYVHEWRRYQDYVHSIGICPEGQVLGDEIIFTEYKKGPYPEIDD